jgi:AraC-like DNA-binding protein
LALILPSGVEGAVVAGFYGVLDAPCPIRVFGSRNHALTWLGEVPEVAITIAEAVAETTTTPALLGALHCLVRDTTPALDIDAAARALGLSVRTLQRRLREEETSFSRELQAARIEQAKRRLRETSDPITVVAMELGFASSQHFSSQFRALVGKSPSDWRKTK